LPVDKIVTSGGGAANAAKVAAYLGIPTAFIGAVGKDRFGNLFKKELKKAGVFLHLARKKSPTGMFISLTSKKPGTEDGALSKHIIASPSAALELDVDDLDEKIFKGREDIPRVFFLEGFLLEREQLAGRVLELAVTHRISLAIDMGTAEIAAKQATLIQQGKSLFWPCIGKIPLILFFNESEAEAFANVFNTGWEEYFTELSKAQFILIAVKLAEKGAVVFSDGGLYRHSAEPVETSESTGAGDAFAAGFLAAWLRGENVQNCGNAGNTAAAHVLKVRGA
jgi:fructokinase